MILKRILCLFIISSFFLTSTNYPIRFADATTDLKKPTLEKAQKMLQTQNGFFTENKGQWDSDILFVGDTSFGKVAFTKDAICYQMIKVTEKESKNDSDLSMEYIPNRFDQKGKEREYESQLVKLSFADSLTPTIQGAEVLTHYNNYFIGNDPKKWASNCRNFSKVTYENIWQGIDLAYFFTPEGMKYEYYVKPEANIQQLQMKVDGASLSTQSSSMQITTKLGSIQDANLKVFDTFTGATIQSNFILKNNIFSFHGIPEKRKNIIVIDPLVYSTYLGGSSGDYGRGLAVDTSGNVYIAGSTYSTNFPTTSGAYQTSNPNNLYDAFVAKLNVTGTSILYSTYIGGTDNDFAYRIAIDLSGNVYIAGGSYSTDFPTTSGVYQTTNKGGADAFVTKLNPTGTSLLYSTYLGSSASWEYGYRIAVDSTGNAYVTGNTQSPNFPTTLGTYQSVFKGGEDVFVTKLNSTGTALIFSTYIGGSGWDYGYGISVDPTGNVYITGNTSSSDFPTIIGAYQTTNNGNMDGFVVKLNSTGTTLLYSTYLGGSSNEYVEDIAVDPLGNAYITGEVESTDYPTTLGAYQTTNNGNFDVFISKVNTTGTALLFSSYLGGTDNDNSLGYGNIELDTNNNIYLTGRTKSVDYPTTSGAYQTANKGNWDVFVSKFNSAGTSLLYSTYLGGTGDDGGHGIVLDTINNVYLCGETDSSDFPTTSGVYQTSYKGNDDAFVAKLSILDISLPDVPLPIGSKYRSDIVNTGDYRTTTNTGSLYFGSEDGYIYSLDSQSGLQNWKVDTGNPIWSSPSIMEGKVFIGALNSYLYSLNESDGAENWKLKTKGMIENTASFSGANLYFGGWDKNFYSLAKSSGAPNWQQTTADSIDSSPCISGDVVYFGNRAGNLSAYHKDTGNLIWSYAMGSIEGSPTCQYGNVYVGSDDGYFYAINQTSGSHVWKSAYMLRIKDSSPAIKDGIVYIGSMDHSLYALNAYTGEEIWKQPTLDEIWSSPCVANGKVFVGSNDGYLYAFHKDTGTLLWKFQTNDQILECSPAYADGKVYIGSNDHYVYAINASTGDLMWKFKTGGAVRSSPSIGDFTITLPSASLLKGTLVVNQVYLTWTPAIPGTFAIHGYQIYRADVMDNVFQPLAYIKGVNNPTYTDSSVLFGKTYAYYIVAIDTNDHPSPNSNVVKVGPIQALKPILELSIETNKTTLKQGDDVLYKVYVHNTGNADATNVTLNVTFPPEIHYVKNDKFFGNVQPNGEVVINIGTVHPGTITFQINAVINTSITYEKSVATVFDLKAQETDTIRKIVNLILTTNRTGSPGDDGSVSLKFLNTKTDPETGERFIDQSTELDMEMIISGFTSPCIIKILWGDGETETIPKTKETTLIYKHKFTSKGTMQIQITITDATGKTKTVTAKLRVK